MGRSLNNFNAASLAECLTLQTVLGFWGTGSRADKREQKAMAPNLLWTGSSTVP